MGIPQNIENIKATLPNGVQLIAVSKTKPNEDIMEAYNAGTRVFGENKPQELMRKYEELPKDIEWHFIGHLQTNKVKYIAPFVTLIHGVESIKLLKEINKQAVKNNRVIDCLLQFHIAEEDTKFGLSLIEAEEILDSESFKALQNIRIVGVMGMATYTNNPQQIENEFESLRNIFNILKTDFFADTDSFKELSMGMSGDYQLAIKHGSTMVRIGSTIFGARNY